MGSPLQAGMVGGWLLLALHLSAASAASFKNGRPDRPPLIWKWLSNAFGVEDEVTERVDLGHDIAVNDTKDDTKIYLEDLAETGFNITGVYLSPDSVLNPVKWAELLHGVGLLPTEVAAALRIEPSSRTTPYENEATGNYAAKSFGMATTVVCFVTDIFKDGAFQLTGWGHNKCNRWGIGLEFDPREIWNVDPDDDDPSLVPCTDYIGFALDTLCKALVIGEKADTFRSGNCKVAGLKDSDCGSGYVCNIHRGVCEIACLNDASCKGNCKTTCSDYCTSLNDACKGICSAEKATCDTNCIAGGNLQTCLDPCATAKTSCDGDCDAKVINCPSGCDAECNRHFCSKDTGVCNKI